MENLVEKLCLLFFIIMHTCVCIRPEAYENGTIVLTREYVIISCFGHSIDYINAVPAIGKIHVPHVTINECRPSSAPYATGLRAINVDVESIRSLHLRTIPDQPQLNAVNLEGLSLEELRISSPREKYVLFNSINATIGYTLRPASDFLAPLEKLSKLNISRAVLLPFNLSASTPLEEVSLANGKSLGVWGECSQLRKLSVTKWDVTTRGWLARCFRLTSLSLLRVPSQALPYVLSGVSSLLFLAIIDCGLNNLDHDASDQLFRDLPQLQQLDLSNNHLNSIQDNAMEFLGSLVELNLSHNQLTFSAPLLPALAFLPGLRTLTLNNNPLGDWCMAFTMAGPLRLPSGLQRLSLRATGATQLCQERQLIPDSLTYLDLAENEVKVLKFQSLPIARTLVPLEIDLRQNPIQEVLFRKPDYDFLFNKGGALDSAAQMTVRVESSVQCDCEHVWLARALRDFPHLSLRGLRCAHRGQFENEPPARLECERWSCWDNCTCRRWWNQGGAVDAHCTALHAVPRVPGLRELHAHQNSIDILHAEDLPDTLLFLDLSNNTLSRADGAMATALFGVDARRVRLAGNPLACTCDNEPFLTALQRHRAQVEDYVNVTCSGGLSLSGVATGKLCRAAQDHYRREALLPLYHNIIDTEDNMTLSDILDIATKMLNKETKIHG